MNDDPFIDPLAGADSAAEQCSDTPLNYPAVSCPLAPKAWLELIVVGEDGVGLPDIAVELSAGDARVLRARTDNGGVVCFAGIEPGSYQACLDELDEQAWDLLGQTALSPAERNAGLAPWEAARVVTQVAFTHVVQPGECMAALADRYGFTPGALWDLPSNAALQGKRESMYALYAGDGEVEADQVVIPPRTRKAIPVHSGQRYRVRRNAVPELLHVEFAENDVARAEVAYLIDITGADGGQWAVRKGVTGTDGSLRVAIPPGALHATVTLLLEPESLIYEFELGYLDPAATLSGVQHMLENLGYPCDAELGSMGPQTQAALDGFRRAHGLPLSYGLDELTRGKIREAYTA